MLFGGKKKEDEADDEAMKKMGEQMQKLSERIGQLQRQLTEKTAEADQLRGKAAQSIGTDVALQDANAQMEVLRKQIGELQQQAQQHAASASAAASSSAAVVEGTKAAPPSVGSISGAVQKEMSAVAGGLAAGATAYVTRAGGLPLRMRSGPSLNDSILDRLQPGTQMTLLDGPRQSDGHAWWHIRTSDGREGWVAGEDLRTQPD
jgi:hypothetical protein